MSKICFHTVATLGFIDFMEPWLKSHINHGDIVVHFIGNIEEWNYAKTKLAWATKRIRLIFVDIEDEISSLENRFPGSKKHLQKASDIGRFICENYSVNSANRSSEELFLSIAWKQLISVEIRYRSLIENAYQICQENGNGYLVHCDSDMMLIGDIRAIINTSSGNSIGLVIKDNHQLSDPYRRILGCLLILKIDSRSKAYLEGVKATIDKQDFLVQPKSFGQKALYDAWQSLNNHSKECVYPIRRNAISFRNVNKPAIYFAGNVGDKRSAKWIMLMAYKMIESNSLPRALISLLMRGSRILYVIMMTPVAMSRKIQNACR